MKKLYLILFILINLSAEDVAEKSQATLKSTIKPISISMKKKRFYALIVPHIKRVHQELQKQYLKIKSDVEHFKNTKRIEKLKNIYKVQSNEELLLALKPHPKSIVLAQAAMESAWGTSRFFKQANNVFGMWSLKKSDKRIAATEKRKGQKTIWLKKFDNIEESIREYYKTIGRARAYHNFRKYRYESDNVFKIIQGLDVYSEMGKKYVSQLGKMIKYNKLTKYD